MSNSKLNDVQKTERKQLMQQFLETDSTIDQNPETGVTMVTVRDFPNSKMVRISFSFMSDDEQKFRRKVGEYHALHRMFWSGEYIYIPTNRVFDLWKTISAPI